MAIVSRLPWVLSLFLERTTNTPATTSAITTTAMMTPNAIFLVGNGFFGGTGTVFSGSCSGSSSAIFSRSAISPPSSIAECDGSAAPSNVSDPAGTTVVFSVSESSCGCTTAPDRPRASSSIFGKLSEGMFQSSSNALLCNRSAESSSIFGKPLSSTAIFSPISWPVHFTFRRQRHMFIIVGTYQTYDSNIVGDMA